MCPHSEFSEILSTQKTPSSCSGPQHATCESSLLTESKQHTSNEFKQQKLKGEGGTGRKHEDFQGRGSRAPLGPSRVWNPRSQQEARCPKSTPASSSSPTSALHAVGISPLPAEQLSQPVPRWKTEHPTAPASQVLAVCHTILH